MDFRRAEIDDFLAIAALDRGAWQENRHPEFIPDGEHVWRVWVEHADVFCAQDENGEIVGAILAFPGTSGLYCLHKVFVNRILWGQGVGTRLFEVLIEALDRKRAEVFLTVDPHNEAALALYEKWGFVEKTFVPSYYRAHEDRYVLTRPAYGTSTQV